MASRPVSAVAQDAPAGGRDRRHIDADHRVRVPTLVEILRIKAYLVVQRNAVRDYLDTAALADQLGTEQAARVLVGIDGYYADRSGEADSVLSELVLRLAEPRPKDTRVTAQLSSYKGVASRWQDWEAVVQACQELADRLVEMIEEEL